jgi:hypothetical protein
MKFIRPFAVVLAVCALVFACGDPSPTAPTTAPAPDASLIGDLLRPTGLLRCSDLPAASVTRTIGPAGGSLTVGPHVLWIPPGALAAPTSITAKIVTGQGVNGIAFQPEGLRFQTAAALTMSYANCNLLGKLLPKRIAYTTNALQILEYLLSVDFLFSKNVTGKVNHFSEYVIAW